ncbi:unnamed protein product [Blepharisma stoltei]|uniref:Uncharacterized protein n=1 Tax=Blepharisma stoltei TaxID=1481888 RepID=A0AAU9J8H9_9CILI|nr:unnamed protein product [Blepharisma stoltei]
MWERACVFVESIPDDIYDELVDEGYLDDILDDFIDEDVETDEIEDEELLEFMEEDDAEGLTERVRKEFEEKLLDWAASQEGEVMDSWELCVATHSLKRHHLKLLAWRERNRIGWSTTSAKGAKDQTSENQKGPRSQQNPRKYKSPKRHSDQENQKSPKGPKNPKSRKIPKGPKSQKS